MDSVPPTPAGEPTRCPICDQPLGAVPAHPPGDVTCQQCNSLLWFPATAGLEPVYAFLRLAIADPSIRTKPQAIRAILDRLVAAGSLPAEHHDGVLAAILRREELGSTGVGHGVAIPHCKYPLLEHVVGAVADFKVGVQFDAVDGKLVHLVCLFVSVADRPAEHVRVLEAVARDLYRRG